MTGSVFVDTNVLVYAYDRAEPEKQRRALAVLDYLVAANAGVISTQKRHAYLAASLLCERLERW